MVKVGEGSRSGVKVGVKVLGVKVGARVKIEGGVMVGGSRSGEGSRFRGQGCGQGRGVKVVGSRSGI